jgi:hypothetical protein
MWKSALIAAGVLSAGPLVAAEADAAVGSKVTTSTRGACPQTGTHLHSIRDGRCLTTSTSVRSYSRDEIQNTGHIDLAQALRQLDPRFF